MALPTNPANNQQATVRGIVHKFNSTKGAWERITNESTATSLSVSGIASTGAISATALSSTGTLMVSGNSTLGAVSAASGLFSGQISSTVSTGTAPLEVSSTTAVANLNADMLDGSHRDTAHNSFGSGTIPVRHSSGYLYTNYLNTTAGVTTTAASHIAIQTGDSFIRWQTPGQFLSSPPAIGSTTPAAGSFTTLSATGTLSLVGVDNEILMAGITTEPSSPSSGQLLVYSKSVGGRMMLKQKGPGGIDTPLQAFIGMNKIAWWNPPGNATTVPGVLGFTAPTAQGTATARAVATTNILTRMKRLGYVSAATAGSLCGHYVAVAQFTVGNGSGLGGFYYCCRFGVSDATIQANARMFVGLTSSVAAATNVEPSTLTNAVGVGCGTADTNLKIFYGGSAAQTPIDLGANFPDNLNTEAYELILFSPTNVNNVVYYRVVRLSTGAEASGTITAATAGTQLPASTTLMTHRVWRATQAAVAAGIDVCSVYIETDY